MNDQSFHKASSLKRYKIWRIVRCSGAWIEIYRHREKRLRNYKSAIIFPEQLLELNQSTVWSAHAKPEPSSNTSTDSIVIGITKWASFQPCGSNSRLRSIEEILDFEDQNSKSEEVHRLTIGKSNIAFKAIFLFSNQREAFRFATSQGEKLLPMIS